MVFPVPVWPCSTIGRRQGPACAQSSSHNSFQPTRVLPFEDETPSVAVPPRCTVSFCKEVRELEPQISRGQRPRYADRCLVNNVADAANLSPEVLWNPIRTIVDPNVPCTARSNTRPEFDDSRLSGVNHRRGKRRFVEDDDTLCLEVREVAQP